MRCFAHVCAGSYGIGHARRARLKCSAHAAKVMAFVESDVLLPLTPLLRDGLLRASHAHIDRDIYIYTYI